jgi:hypothetical protein
VEDLKFYIHSGAAFLRFEIEGNFSGEGARQAQQSWSTALSVIGDRSLIISVGNLSRIDPVGRALLCSWGAAGAQFLVQSPLTRTLIGSIVGESFLSYGESSGSCMGDKRFGGGTWLRKVALPLIPVMALLCPSVARAAHLEPVTSQAWDEYVKSATTRMERRLSPGESYLWVDEDPDRLARVRAGEIVVAPMGEHIPMKVSHGLIHHWVGTVFIPNASINDVLQVVRDYPKYKDLYQPSVIDSKVIEAGQEKDRFSMLLMNKSLILKSAFDADYESCYIHVDDRSVYSISRTTRLQQIEEYGSPAQHVLDEGQGSGIIWRLEGITRYMQRDGGVYIELEAIGLSRDIPGALRWFVEPTVRRVSRSSLATSLEQTQKAVRVHAEQARRQPGNSRAGTSEANSPFRLHLTAPSN